MNCNILFKSITTAVFISIGLFSANAQFSNAVTLHAMHAPENNAESAHTQNIIKLNALALLAKNFSFQYERVLRKRVSAAIGIAVMPRTKVPFKNFIADDVARNEDVNSALQNFRINSFSITPEVRFYLGRKGYGRGFYIAPFYRYASYEASNLGIEYDATGGVKNKITMAGKLTSNTGGLLFGAQWELGSRINLDWWIAGPNFGGANGSFSGTTDRALTLAEQNDIRNELTSIDPPFSTKKVTVSANNASMELSGPWAGIRAGVAVGLRF